MWRKSKSKTVLSKANASQDLLAIKIARAGIKIQNLFATFLAKQTAKLSASKLKIIVVLFIIAWLIAIMYFISSDFANVKPHNTVYISHLKHPSLAGRTVSEKSIPVFTITEDEFKEMQLFRKYMDSLGKHAIKSYDSILLSRPGLMDSILILEQMYNHQKK